MEVRATLSLPLTLTLTLSTVTMEVRATLSLPLTLTLTHRHDGGEGALLRLEGGAVELEILPEDVLGL